MLPYDAEKTAQIWKRVHGQTPAVPDPSELLQMIKEEWTDAVTYLHLSHRFRGKQSAVLRQIAWQEQAHYACLKGIYTMLTGAHPHIHAPSVPREPLGHLLRRCYNRELQCVSCYQARIDEPEHGPSFARLAAQDQEHCHILLQILGSLKPKG